MHARLFVLASILIPAVPLQAQERLIEEIIVTAQRVEENAQRVPISLSAFTDAMLEDRQLIGISDIQAFVPNFSYSESQSGVSQIWVRGIGNLSETGSESVQAHVNDIPLRFPPKTEFYDLERLEVLRGPQSTLFGRNSTAGTVNAITKRPRLKGNEGHVELDVGNYGLVRVRAAGEVAFTDSLGIRIAGMKLDRDGYIDNLANRDVPEVDGDLDGRDVYSFRITPRWDVSDRTSLWVMYEQIREDDDRVRITNQVCKASDFPVLGCDPDAFGLEAVNQASTGFHVLAVYNDMIPLGASDAGSGLQFDVPRPELGIREQHTDLEPKFELDVDFWNLGIEHDFDFAHLSLLGGYRKRSNLLTQDRHMDVGFTLNPTAFNATGLWPTSKPPESGDPFGGPCPALEGLAGVHGGCVVETNETRYFTFDQLYRELESSIIEAKLTNLDGEKLSWLIGARYEDSRTEGTFYIPNNILDAVGVFGIPRLGIPPLYPAPLDGTAGTNKLETYAVFGEVYWKVSEAIKLTAGLRYTDDRITQGGVPFGVSSFDFLGDWLRVELESWLSPAGPDEAALALTDYYGVTAAARNAGSFEELVSVLQEVPPMWTFGESQGVLSLPESYSADYVTGRVGIDWQVTPVTMIYAFYNRGRKPGGFESFYFAPLPFDDEVVDAIEIGGKTLMFDESLQLNVAVFHNAYNGLQYKQQTPIATKNIDAEIWGIEIESRWRPRANLDLEFTYAYLNAKVDDFSEYDLLDPAQGDPSLVTLKSFDLDGPGNNFVANRSEVLAITPQAVADSGALPAPGAVYSDGIPLYFSRGYLDANGVKTSDGVPADLDGNRLPNAPPHQIHVGIAYTWFFNVGALTARWDYYWQDKMYARPFNRPGDEIDSWSQHNASIWLTSADGRWTAKAWIRNIENEDNVTGQYVEEPVSGAFRNYFLTEPRTYGATLRYNFGAH